jgi:hypothetical protein
MPTAFDTTFARLQIHVETACVAEEEWAAQIAAGIRAALAFAVRDPAAVRTLTKALAGGRDGCARYDRMLSHFGERLLPGRAVRPGGDDLPEITEKAMVGGLATLIAQFVDTGRAGELPALAPEAIQFVLTPYVGTGEARRVAATEF